MAPRAIPPGVRRRRFLLSIANHSVGIVIALVFMLPLLFVILTSFMTPQQAGSSHMWPNPWEWGNYRKVFDLFPAWHYLFNTLTYAVLSTVGVLFSSVLVAYALSRMEWRGRGVVFLLVLSTLMLPSQVTIVPLYVVFVNLHWIGSLKPLIVPAFFGDAFSIFLLRQFFMTIPQELSDAARVDGAGEFRILWRVIIPLAKPGIAAVGAVPVPVRVERLLQPAAVLGQQPEQHHVRGGPHAAAADAARALRRVVQRVDGRRAAVHDPGADHLLLRAARVHRGRDAHRRQGMTTRVALFGTGWIMQFHARAVLEHPGAELVAAANWREESLGRLAETFAVPRTTTRWEDLAEDPDVDAVVIATPNALHAPQAIACLRAGKHVLVEKPMAATLDEAERMAEAARASEAFLMVAHCWRFHEDVRRLRERIAAGEFGEVVKTRGYGVHAKWGPSGWFTRARPGGRRGAAGHGRARHRHRPLPAGRSRASARVRRGRPPLRRLRTWTTTGSC